VSSDTGDLVVRGIDSLPTLSVVATRVAEVIHSKTVSVQAVAEALRPDPALSAKLLRLVNSPYYGIPGGVSDIARAIPFVGFNTLYQLVLSVSVFEALDADAAGFDPRALWMHSLISATAARELAIEVRHPEPGTCFTAALLHDIGKFALAKIDPERSTLVHGAVTREGVPQREAEARYGLAAHDHVGGQLAKHWRFPAGLAVPIRRHDDIRRPEQRERIPPQVRSTTEVVAIADAIADKCTTAFCSTVAEQHEDTAWLLDALGYTPAQLDGLRTRTCGLLERSRIFLSVLESPRRPARPSRPPPVSAAPRR
jgi:HD-like signal output (HDOD) protein